MSYVVDLELERGCFQLLEENPLIEVGFNDDQSCKSNADEG